MIDGKVWYLVFTDTEKLRAYAKRHQNLDPEGNALVSDDDARGFSAFCAGVTRHNCVRRSVQ